MIESIYSIFNAETNRLTLFLCHILLLRILSTSLACFELGLDVGNHHVHLVDERCIVCLTKGDGKGVHRSLELLVGGIGCGTGILHQAHLIVALLYCLHIACVLESGDGRAEFCQPVGKVQQCEGFFGQGCEFLHRVQQRTVLLIVWQTGQLSVLVDDDEYPFSCHSGCLDRVIGQRTEVERQSCVETVNVDTRKSEPHEEQGFGESRRSAPHLVTCFGKSRKVEPHEEQGFGDWF